MTNKPIIHTFHYGDIREPIFSKLEQLLTTDYLVQQTAQGAPYISTRITDKNKRQCDICIVKLENGALIQTAFPGQPDTYNRLWMLEPYLGGITYMEIGNPDLRTAVNFDATNPDGNAFELGAFPEDLVFLNSLLGEAVEQALDGDLQSLQVPKTVRALLGA